MNGATLLDDLILKRHHEEMRQFWQARLLLHAHEAGDRQIAAVVLSVVAHGMPAEAFITLMHVCFPGFGNIRPPFYASAGKIMKGGEIAADLKCRDGSITRNTLVFRDKREMESAWRKLCDEIGFNDEDRAAAFAALRKWVVADFRRDPNRPVEAA